MSTSLYATPAGTARFAYLLRLLPVLCVVFAAGIFVMGLLADPAIFHPKPLGARAVPVTGAARGGVEHWRTIHHFATHVPEVCWGENAVNEFQRRQCGEFWEQLQYGLALSALPFALALIYLKLAFLSLGSVYARARKLVAGGRPIAKGIVTEPALGPRDLFSWFYGFKPVTLQTGEAGQAVPGRQLTVYIAADAPLPRPGQTMMIFAPVSSFGAKRHFGVLYTPHVAVVKGARRV